VGLAYRPWPWLTLAMDARWVSSQYLRGDDANRQPPLPGYWVANGVRDRPLARLQTFVRINNVLDNRYETFGTFALNGAHAGGAGGAFLDPSAPDQCPGRPPVRVLTLPTSRPGLDLP
jgi:iron complex outermembrane receptor protein